MRRYHETFRLWEYLLFAVVTLAVLCLCVCIGSVRVPLGDTLAFFAAKLTGGALPEGLVSSIMPIRLPRVLCVALTGAALSLAGAAMQGLLKNPLADGSTLGVSSGASLGAVCAIAFGVTLPGFPFAGTMVMAILFAFGSLLVILGLSYKLDRSLSTNTIILIGVIYSMFVSSVLSLVITFAPDKVQSITFWTMGSLAGRGYVHVLVLLGALVVFGGVLFGCARELNAFAVGEDNARQIGVDVKRAKLMLLIMVSVLIGVCVSVGGTIGFVGLVTPHMARMLVGPNHRRLLPAAMFGGAPSQGAADFLLEDDETLTLAGIRLRVLHTPGHTKGSCCFLTDEGQLFSGDTLFRRGWGRTDFPGGSEMEMAASLERLRALSPETRVCPGHGLPTTIGEER